MYKKFTNRKFSIGLINILIVGITWYILSILPFIKGTIPNPFSVIKILLSTELFTIISRLCITLLNVLIILAASTLIGYPIGFLCGYNKYINSQLYPIFNSLKSIPITVLLPVFIVVFHLDYFLYPLIAVPLIANLSVNISQSVSQINENRLNIVSLMGIKKKRIFIHIYFWETVEPLLTTMRILVTYALTIEIALDYFLRTSQGIGSYIFSQYNSYDEHKYSYMFAGILIVSIVGISSIKLVDLISNKLLKWKEKI